jgi:Arc/MetJ family transcription regulator
MRFSISVDPGLLDTAIKVTRARTKRETIELALQALIQEHRRAEAVRHAGAFPLTITQRGLRRLRHRH